MVSPFPSFGEGGVAESRGGRWIHNADNNGLAHSPTTSPTGTPPPRRRRIKIVLLNHLAHYFFVPNSFFSLSDTATSSPVQFIFKNPVSLLNLIQREAVCDKWRGVYLAFFDQAKYLGAIAPVHATGLKVRFFPYISGRGSTWGGRRGPPR